MNARVKVIGQISAAENILHVLPSSKKIGDFSAQALKKVPGVARCCICICGEPRPSGDLMPVFCEGCDIAFRSVCPEQELVCRFDGDENHETYFLNTPNCFFGVLILEIGDPGAFSFYSPFVSNFSNAITINMENIWQKEQLQTKNRALEKYRCSLESLVKERTEQLEKSEQLLANTQKLAKVGGWVWDVASQTMTWTEQTYRIHGLEPGEVEAGSPEHVERSLSCYDPNDRPVIEAAFLRCTEQGIPYDLEFPFTTVKGRRRWIHTMAQSVCEGRRIVRVIGNIVDITERKQAEEALRHRLEYEQLLNEASMIAFVSNDLAELHDRCLALVGERLGVDRAYFFKHDEATDTMDNIHEWCAEGTALQQDKLQGIPCSDFPWWIQTMLRNEIICYPDIEEIPDESTKKILMSQNIKSILVVPLFINGQYYGFLGLDDCTRRREWRQEDVEIFLSLSRIVAMATERMQAKKRLQDERQQLLSIFNGIEEAIYIADPETYEVVFVNDFLRKLLTKDLLGKKCYEQFQGVNAPCEFCTNQILVKNPGEVYRWEYYNPKLNRHYLLFDRIIKWTDGRDMRFEMAVDITERKIAEEALKKSEASLKEAQRLAEIGSWALNPLTGELSMSDQMYNIIGLDRTPDALDVAAHEKYYTPESWQRFRSAVETARETGKSYEIEMEVVRDGGGNRHVVARGEVLKDETGQTTVLRGTLQDITERVNLQAQLNQAQKMESVGRLAGGVAHDFNNMLGVILGHTEMALEQVARTEQLHADLEEIQKAAQRSADITRQLLAFARKQTTAPKVIDLNKTVNSALKMIKRLIGEDIELAWLPEDSGLCPIKMDPSQIDQILTNLCVNARDAISDVGKITIETGRASFDDAHCADHPGFVPGDFVLLAVSDDGCGMDKQTLANLFEPFFTTKDVDKGTGLGLATVYGIVKQNNGFVNAYSEPGKGTTLKIYLPRHAAKTARETKKSPLQTMELGRETILLVEDELSILKMTRMMLERIGYKVLAAGTPGEAIEIACEHAGEIHLLMTDVVMPEMNGRDLAKNLLSLYPNLKRLFMSGYTANVIAHHGVLDEGVNFIQKPFSKQDLSVKLREVLDNYKS